MSTTTHPRVPIQQQRLGGRRNAKIVALALGFLAAVVVTLVLVIDGDSPAPSPQSGAEAVAPARAPVSPLNGTTRYDGGPEEGSRGATTQAPARTAEGQAFPGLSEQAREATEPVVPPPSSIAQSEGSAYGQLRRAVPPATRYDGGPEEGTRGATQTQSPDGPTPFSGSRP